MTDREETYDEYLERKNQHEMDCLEARAKELEAQLAERDKQLAALKNELGHDRVEQAEYIAAQTDQINALNKQLAETLSDSELASLKQCWLSSPRDSKSVSLPHDDFSRLLATIAARDARIKELEDEVAPIKWIDVNTAKPEAEKKVLVCVKCSHYRKPALSIGVAFYAPRFTVETDAERDWFETKPDCENDDEMYLPEGFYQFNEYVGDDTYWFIDDDVTHWAEMPARPVVEQGATDAKA